MNIPLLLAFLLTSLAFLAHTFVGDREIGDLEPETQEQKTFKLRSRWTMARCGWHWISFDLLVAALVMGFALFSDILLHESYLLSILAFYFLGYAIVWLVTIFISRPFPQRLLYLGQWALLLLISGLLYWSA